MDTQRIEVLHVTNRNTVVAGISDNLVYIHIYLFRALINTDSTLLNTDF
jgi:hypothetical protein